MPKHITLPRRADTSNLPAVLRALQVGDWSTSTDDLVVDWAALEFADPVGIVMLTAYCITTCRQGASLRFENFDSACYAARVRIKPVCGLLDDYPHARYASADRFTDITRVHTAEEGERFAADAASILRVDDQVALLSRYSLAEILRNVYEHTFSRCNAIAACQYYPNRREVRYAVADTGEGIPAKVRQKVGPMSAKDAIVQAAQPRFTTALKRKGNLGIGLTVSKEVACQAGGSFLVASEDALVTWRPGSISSARVGWWPGTCVAGRIPQRPSVSLEAIIRAVESS